MGREFAVYPAIKNCIRKVECNGQCSRRAPPRFARRSSRTAFLRVHPSEFTREFRAPSPPAVPPSGDQGANVTRNLRAFVLPSTRRVRPDGESRFCIAANFFSSACARIRVIQVSSSNDRRSGEVSGFCGNLLCRSRYDVAISIFDRGADIYIYFFLSSQSSLH